MTKTHRLEQSQFIPRPREEVFSFFADAANLERLTPAFLHFRILTPLPIPMKPGALIYYELKLYGVPVRWRTRIETFEPSMSFTDIQLSGPYRRWHHRHEFVEVPGGTEMRDIVDYELPLGLLGVAARWLFVRRALESIFDYRRAAITEIFGLTCADEVEKWNQDRSEDPAEETNSKADEYLEKNSAQPRGRLSPVMRSKTCPPKPNAR